MHNSFVVEELRGKGAIFVDSEDEVPNGERIIYSAHGVSPDVREHSTKRGLRVIDATCPPGHQGARRKPSSSPKRDIR